MKSPKASGVFHAAAKPWASNLSFTSGSASAFFSSALRRAITSGGVPAGASRPFRAIAPEPGRPDSATVGSSGAAPERLALVTASALSLPAFTCGMAERMVSNISCAWPPITSVSAGALPLYGMCVIFTPAIEANSSAARWVDWPLPDDAKLSTPGLALASAMSSVTSFAGRPGGAPVTGGPLGGWVGGVVVGRGRESEHARPGLGQRDELGHVVRWQSGVRHDHERAAGELRHGRKVFIQLVAEVFEERGADRMRSGCQHQRVAIGRAARRPLGPRVAARAGPVVDDELLAGLLRQLLRQHARHDIRCAARRVRHDQPDRLVRVALRPGCRGSGRKTRGGAQCGQQPPVVVVGRRSECMHACLLLLVVVWTDAAFAQPAQGRRRTAAALHGDASSSLEIGSARGISCPPRRRKPICTRSPIARPAVPCAITRGPASRSTSSNGYGARACHSGVGARATMVTAYTVPLRCDTCSSTGAAPQRGQKPRRK